MSDKPNLLGGKGKRTYNNGVVAKRYFEGEQPEGFVLGMLPRTEEQKAESNAKRVKTTIDKYGVSNVAQSKDVYDRIIETNLKKYGVEHHQSLESQKEKVKKTNLERYGTTNGKVLKPKVDKPKKEKKVKASRTGGVGKVSLRGRGTFYNNGVTNRKFIDGDAIPDGFVKESNLEKYGVERPAQSDEVKRKTIETNRKRYGVDYTCLVFSGKLNGNDSSYNRAFAELLDDNNIKYEREFLLQKYSYDFKVGNTLVEINPTATHNTHFNPYGKNRIDVNYHRDKSKLARDSGYHVIHVFDWDDTDKVVQLLKDRVTVYAINCEVRLVDTLECNQYLMAYHLQGKCNNQTIRLGLYHDNQLVSLMTFGVARYNKKYEYELLRYCASHNVVGGAEKLFKYFVGNYKPISIISYCDTSKFSGKVYDTLEFSLDTINSPSCHWYSVKEDKHITDNLLRMQGYDRLFKESHGKGTSNEELILARGYLPVYDCGQATYIWRSDKNVE